VFLKSSRIILLSLAIASLLHPGRALATSTSTTPKADAEAACAAPPRSREALSELLANTTMATPVGTTQGQTLPEGTPADPDVAAAMEAIVRQWLACQNGGEPLRAWSLFSDGYLYRLLSRQGGLSDEAYAALATPAPPAPRAAELLEIRGQRILPDGRFGATVVIEYPSVPMPKTFFFFFTRENDRLVIDGILGEISFSVG
jgi:hypothetical protein